MNKKGTLINVIITTVITVLAACSDDGNPPPGLDCNVTGPSISLMSTPSLCGEDNGEIALTIDGGTGNLTVNIDPQPIGIEFANNTFTSLEPGTYTIDVVDADNCSSNAMATVAFNAGNVSYQDSVDPIVQARCAIAGCHVAGTGLPDYTIFSVFQARANNDPGNVRQRLKIDDMPRSGDPLSAEEKAAIFCWIDEGAQDN